jgi:SAM-dependent methyltransferase
MSRRVRRLLGRRDPEIYLANDFLRRERWRPDYQLLADALLDRLTFDSVLDVGCGNGFLLQPFLEAGKDVQGVELSPAVREILPSELLERVLVGDFAQVKGSWDLVCCVEVAEHLPPPRSRQLVSQLTETARHWIYFTAALPGQPGHGHINCRPHEEWMEWFHQDGWGLDPEATATLRERLEALPAATWLRGNSFLLRPVPASFRPPEPL